MLQDHSPEEAFVRTCRWAKGGVREAYLVGVVFPDDLFLNHLQELYVVPWENKAHILTIRTCESTAESILVCFAMPFKILLCRTYEEAICTSWTMACDVAVGVLRGVYPQPLPLPDKATDLVEIRCVCIDPELLEPVEQYDTEWADENEEYDLPYRDFNDHKEKCHKAVDNIGYKLTDIQHVPEIKDGQQANDGYYRRNDAPLNPFRPF